MFLSCSGGSGILILTILDFYLTVLGLCFMETICCEILSQASVTHYLVIAWDVHMVDLNWDMIDTRSIHL